MNMPYPFTVKRDDEKAFCGSSFSKLGQQREPTSFVPAFIRKKAPILLSEIHIDIYAIYIYITCG